MSREPRKRKKAVEEGAAQSADLKSVSKAQRITSAASVNTEQPANQAADRSGEINHRLTPSPNTERGAVERMFKLGGSDEHRRLRRNSP
jgi:hypothetical protein